MADHVVRDRDREVVNAPDEGPVFSESSLEALNAIARTADSRVEALKTIRMAALKLANKRNWIDFHNKPYLDAAGAEKVAQIGVSISDVKGWREDFEDEDGKYYVWTYAGRFILAGRALDAVGTCSSRDQFFAATDDAELEYRPLEKVDQTNIQKAAYSNLIVNGVTRILGLRGLTWEELEEYGVIDPDRTGVATVQYKGGSKGGTSKTVAEKRIEVWSAVMEMASDDADAARDLLEEITKFKGSDGKEKFVRDPNNLKGKWLDTTLGKVRKRLEDHRKENGGPEPSAQDGQGEQGDLMKDDRTEGFNDAASSKK